MAAAEKGEILAVLPGKSENSNGKVAKKEKDGSKPMVKESNDKARKRKTLQEVEKSLSNNIEERSASCEFTVHQFVMVSD